MEGSLALLIPIVALLGTAAVLFALTPLGRALADRVRPAPPVARGAADETAAELAALRREVAELAERVDFAERLLARERGTGRVGPGPG